MDTQNFTGTGQVEAGQDAFQELLFGIENLTTDETHNVTITNQGFSNGTEGWIAIDYATWEGSLPDHSTQQKFKYNDVGFEYLPALQYPWWELKADNEAYDGILVWTKYEQSEFRFNFTGQSVALYGNLNDSHENFSCNIDGVDQGISSGHYPDAKPQQLICFGDNLHNGRHVLMVKNIPSSSDDNSLSIDYAEVFGSNVFVYLISQVT